MSAKRGFNRGIVLMRKTITIKPKQDSLGHQSTSKKQPGSAKTQPATNTPSNRTKKNRLKYIRL